VAIPGLAILSLLYFAQAREVKRLREWAGRAPERAQELQERVAEQAARTGTIPPQPGRRVVAQPAGRPGGARPARAAPAPAPAHAPAGSGTRAPGAAAAAQRPAAQPAPGAQQQAAGVQQPAQQPGAGAQPPAAGQPQPGATAPGHTPGAQPVPAGTPAARA